MTGSGSMLRLTCGAALLALAACDGGNSVMAPPQDLAQRSVVPGPSNLNEVLLCKDAPAGSGASTFSIVANNTRTTVPNATVALGPGECAAVATAVQLGSVTITETVTAFGTKFDRVEAVAYNDANGGSVGPTETSTDVSYTASPFGDDRGYVVTYFNVAAGTPPGSGCTFTQGYWKNHSSAWPAGHSPSDTFFNSGLTWLEILNTPPKKGNGYLILAHQYIAAVLNGANGASTTSGVDEAVTWATSFFTAAAAGTPAPSGATRNTAVAYAGTLDDYNNGVTGPGHCSD